MKKLAVRKLAVRIGYRRSRGFTLLELGITIAILVVLIAICVPGITGWIRRNDLSRAESELADMVSEAKRMALRSGQTYQVRFDRNSCRLFMEARAASGSKRELEKKGVSNKSVALSKDIQIQFSSDQNQMPITALTLSPVGTISAAGIRVAHRSGIEGNWRTNRLTGTIQIVK